MRYIELVDFWRNVKVGDLVEDSLSGRLCRISNIELNSLGNKSIEIQYASDKFQRYAWELRPTLDYWSNFPQVTYEK